jgi:hypothetical protein
MFTSFSRRRSIFGPYPADSPHNQRRSIVSLVVTASVTRHLLRHLYCIELVDTSVSASFGHSLSQTQVVIAEVISLEVLLLAA